MYMYNFIHIYFLKRKKGILIANGVRIDRKSKIVVNGGSVVINEGVYLRSRADGYHGGMPFNCTLLADTIGSEISIGKETRVNGAYIHAHSKIFIGSKCVIAAGVNILDSNGHIVNSIDRTVGRDTAKPIIIGNNVWIGLNSIILKDTTVGDNSIVSAGSVVKGKFPENSIIQGNPAKVIGQVHIL